MEFALIKARNKIVRFQEWGDERPPSLKHKRKAMRWVPVIRKPAPTIDPATSVLQLDKPVVSAKRVTVDWKVVPLSAQHRAHRDRRQAAAALLPKLKSGKASLAEVGKVLAAVAEEIGLQE